MSIRMGGNLYSVFQMESLRRLILLSYIVDKSLSKSITETIANFKILLSIKPIMIYDEFSKLLNGVSYPAKIRKTLLTRKSKSSLRTIKGDF